MSIIAIDDDESILCLLHKIIDREYGIEVVGYSNVKEALLGCLKTKYELLIVDFHLPYINGWDLQKAIKKLPGYANTPVIICTSDCDSRVRRLVASEPMMQLLLKPFTYDSLSAAVRQSFQLALFEPEPGLFVA